MTCHGRFPVRGAAPTTCHCCAWTRCFIALDRVENAGLDSLSSATFLQRCWHEGVSFDVSQRTGTVFNICPATSSKVLGLVCIAAVSPSAVRTMSDALDIAKVQHPGTALDGM